METVEGTQAEDQRNMVEASPKTPQWGVEPTKGSTPCYAEAMAERLTNGASSSTASAHDDESSRPDNVSMEPDLMAMLLGEDDSDTACVHGTESSHRDADSVYDGDESGSDGQMDIRESIEIPGVVGIADYVPPCASTRVALAALAEMEVKSKQDSTTPVPEKVPTSAIDASKETLRKLRQHARTISVSNPITSFVKSY